MLQKLRSKPGHLIWRAYQLCWNLFAQEVSPLDITPVQEALLLVLASGGEIDQKSLAELVALDASTAGNVIGRLEKRGLITRKENASDRRARLVSVTAKGEALSRKLVPIAQRAADRLLQPLSLVERSEFIRLMRKITGLAGQFDQSPAPAASAKLQGKQILCVGLSGTLGLTIIQRLREDGAEVIDLPAPNIEQGGDLIFENILKATFQSHSGLNVFVIGGSITDELTKPGSMDAISRMQQEVNSRWFTIERLMPFCLDRRDVRIISLALFPSSTTTNHHKVATIASNSTIASLSAQTAEVYHDSGVISNCISPRLKPTPTEITSGSQAPYVAQVPAIDVALAVSYLASDEARSISASNLILG
jgi:DNA-binding MarR family transcriptional regulator/NAD(P)-dependent dehydrogenase (short-subunit alcohol dehydrogenase family)